MASTRITNETRKAFLTNILRDTFAPRFEAIHERGTAWAKASIAAEHPEFIKARKNEKLRTYVPVASGLTLFTTKSKMRKPTRWDGTCKTHEHSEGWVSNGEAGLTEIRAGVDYPSMSTCTQVIDDEALLADYNKLWAEFADAQKTLSDTIAAYTVREKFEADFPSLTKYLPARVAKVCTAVAVPVEDVLTKLAKVGIPSNTGDHQK